MCCPQKFLAREAASCWMEAHWYELEKKTIFWGFLLPPHQIWWLRVSACRERRRTWRGRGRPCIWCCSRPPSDGAGNSHLGKPVNCQFLGLSNLLREKIFLDQGHKRPAVLLFQFWILTGSVGWRNDAWCQWWSSFGSFWWMVLEEIESLSKTTKLLLLDSLLQEVCIESGSHVSHNLLYSGLKKAHSKKKSFSFQTHQRIWMSTRPSCLVHWLRFTQGVVSQSVFWPQKSKLYKMSTATCIPRRSPIQVLTGLNLA